MIETSAIEALSDVAASSSSLIQEVSGGVFPLLQERTPAPADTLMITHPSSMGHSRSPLASVAHSLALNATSGAVLGDSIVSVAALDGGPADIVDGYDIHDNFSSWSQTYYHNHHASLETYFYLAGNLSCLAGGVILIWHDIRRLYRQFRTRDRITFNQDYVKHSGVASQTIYLLFVGSILRAYWSMSPPPVWHDHPPVTQILGQMDVVLSVILWFLASVLAFLVEVQHRRSGQRVTNPNSFEDLPSFLTAAHLKKEDDGTDDDTGGASCGRCCFVLRGCGLFSTSQFWRFVQTNRLTDVRWLLAFGLLLGGLGVYVHGVAPQSINSWPFATFAIFANLSVDGLAMIPQIVNVLNNNDPDMGSAVGSFTGLMCVGRVFRMCFWYLLPPEDGVSWLLVLPDALNTLVFSSYLYHWLAKLRRDACMFAHDLLV